MIKTSPPRSRSWIVVLILSCAFLIWADWKQVQRVRYVTGIAQEEPQRAPNSLTGYAGNTRELIVPEHIEDSYGWIAQTQLMLQHGPARIRQIDYENAPFGRPVYASSPYRWWLGCVAWIDHVASGRPLGLSVERAALLADPLLHLLLLIGTVIFIARQFGAMPASLVSVGMVTLFPFAAGFLPGVPDDYGLMLYLGIWGLLPLLAAFRPAFSTENVAVPDATREQRRARFWFFIGGVIGGVGLWISVAMEAPLLLGIGLGALVAAWVQRRPAVAAVATSGEATLVAPWRAWSIGGAVSVLLAYLIEFAPGHLGDWELRAIHPIYGVAWLGAGEILVAATGWLQRSKTKWSWRDTARLVAGLIGAASLPVLMWKIQNTGFLAVSLQSFRLTKQMDAVLVPSFSQWFKRDGLSGTIWATALPIGILLTALMGIVRRGTAKSLRAALAIAAGPALLAAAVGCLRVRWVQMLDVVLLALLIPVTLSFVQNGRANLGRWLWIGFVACCFGVGVFQLAPIKGTGSKTVLSLPEVEGLVERDLAHWLAKHSTTQAASIVFAPPSVASTLYYYGGMRGLSSFAWENKDGLSVALRIVISTSHEEARALLRNRSVTHLVIPSWNTFFEDYTRSASVQMGEMLLTGLHRWALPPWLKPIPYQLPKIAGFDQQSVMIFEVVDDQDEPVALSRLAEYFLEMGQVPRAESTAQALKRFPADLGALVARAQVEAVRGDASSFGSMLEMIIKRVASGGDRFLPWDRRVSLAVALARGQRMDLARVQTERCLAEIDERKIRSLTTYSLFHLETLRKAFGAELSDTRLRDLMKDLLPPPQGQ
jgi:hypothetical protein